MGLEQKVYKEQLISNYFSSIDTRNIDALQIRKDLKRILQEEPSVRLNYKKDYLMLEDGSKTSERVESMHSVTITYAYDSVDENGEPCILPAQDTFLI